MRRRKTEQAHICLGTNGLARTDPDRFAFLVVNTALGGGMSSRLFQEIRERRGLAYSVYSYHSQYTEAGLFTAYAGTTPARAEQVIGLLRRELEDVASGGLTEEEFERARGHVKGSLVLGLEDPGGRMSRLGKSEIAHGEILSVSQTLEQDRTRHGRRRTPGGRAGTVAADDAHRAGSVPPGGIQGGHGVIRVGVVGAAGRMGREVARAVTADPDLELAAAVDPSHAGQQVDGITIADTLDALTATATDVAVEFTRPTVGPANIAWCVEHGIHVVSGTTGFDPDPMWSEQRDVGVFIAPNFAIGAVLMQRFAEQAIRYLPDAEIIELHHQDKPDAPSGTAMATARRMAAARGAGAVHEPGVERVSGARGGDVEGIRVHSVRLPGSVAHQEVLLGGQGQTLTIRHDSTDWTSFMPGVVMAVKAVASRPGLTVGLDALLGQSEHAARRGLRPSRRRHVRCGGNRRAARGGSDVPVRPHPCHER